MLHAAKAIVDASQFYISLATAVAGGSALVIVGTSHLSPVHWRGRSIYFLFLPAWIFIGLSFYYGERITRRLVAFHLVDKDVLSGIVKKMGDDYDYQRFYFFGAMTCLSVWLILYTAWWVMYREPSK